jgi:hypothetical protein
MTDGTQAGLDRAEAALLRAVAKALHRLLKEANDPGYLRPDYRPELRTLEAAMADMEMRP